MLYIYIYICAYRYIYIYICSYIHNIYYIMLIHVEVCYCISYYMMDPEEAEGRALSSSPGRQTSTPIYIYIYIYRERERDIDIYIYICIYIYIYMPRVTAGLKWPPETFPVAKMKAWGGERDRNPPREKKRKTLVTLVRMPTYPFLMSVLGLLGHTYAMQATCISYREVHKKGHVATGHSVETFEFLTKDPMPCRCMPLLLWL